MRVLGVIPARGGSKSIPNKNIKLLKNKPLIFFTIDAALKSDLSKVVVSTDYKIVTTTYIIRINKIKPFVYGDKIISYTMSKIKSFDL